MIIYKYPLAVQDRQDIRLPVGAKILTAQMQRGSLQLWAMVNETAPVRQETRTVWVFPTGSTLPTPHGTYVATFQMQQGDLVFHVFVGKKASRTKEQQRCPSLSTSNSTLPTTRR